MTAHTSASPVPPAATPGTTPAATAGEPPATARIAALDVLRGIAILGTLASNIWLFAAPGGPAALLTTGLGGDDPVELALRTLSNGKFLGLLTLLFGVGLELQYRSAVRSGTRWPGRYLVRAAILFVEGLLHYVLVFEFDVLMGYAVASVVGAWLIGRSDRVVRVWTGVVAGGFVLALAGVTALLVLGGATADVPGTGVASTASWPDQVLTRLTAAGLYRAELVLIVPSAVVLFVVGSRLVRAGLFTATPEAARLRRRLAGVGLGVGVPLNALTAWAGPDWFLVDRYLVPPLVSLGILALGTGLVARARDARPGVLRRGVEAVGRTALSCYVLQNVLASVLCFDWGFGLAGEGALRAVLLWGAVSAVLLVLAPLWLRRWPRGPIELVMHRVHARRPAA